MQGAEAQKSWQKHAGIRVDWHIGSDTIDVLEVQSAIIRGFVFHPVVDDIENNTGHYVGLANAEAFLR